LTSHQPRVTPNDLRLDPELAILDALDHTLELVVYVLVAIYPELTDSQIPLWQRDDSAPGRAASHLIACSQELEQAVCDYRTAIVRARESETNGNLPF
jgi:hypothetical protein